MSRVGNDMDVTEQTDIVSGAVCFEDEIEMENKQEKEKEAAAAAAKKDTSS